jgi:hypothetical protein
MTTYSGVFFEDGTHMTYDYSDKEGFPPLLPPLRQEGDAQQVLIVGEYNYDGDVALICAINISGKCYKYSPCTGRVLHITKKYKESPNQCGLNATNNIRRIRYFKEFYVKVGKWGFA